MSTWRIDSGHLAQQTQEVDATDRPEADIDLWLRALTYIGNRREAMSNSWCYLEFRYGDSAAAPSHDEIAVAVAQLYDENLPGMTEADYEEHGAASLRYGNDEGPMYVLEITRRGKARWEEWTDQDYNEELCPMREIDSLPREQATLLWTQLAAGEITQVRAFFRTA